MRLVHLGIHLLLTLTQVIRITHMTWLYGFVLRCLVSYSMDFCPAATAESKYGQWSRSHARAWDESLLHSHTSLVFLMITRSVRALENHFVWFSCTSLVTLMSGAWASSSCSCIRHTHLLALASESYLCFMLLFFSFCCSSVSVSANTFRSDIIAFK